MTPEQIEKHRMRFEELMRHKGFVNAHFEVSRSASYRDYEINANFAGYLMHAENLEVEIPELIQSPKDWFDKGYNCAQDLFRSGLKSQGIKIKEQS